MEQSFLLEAGSLATPCKLDTPDFGEVKRIVLGVHGLGGSTQDDIQTSLAEEMTLFSSAVFRFDFPGHGESPMSDAHLTLRACVDTLLSVAAHARKRFAQTEDLCIFATGFGAYITLVALDALLEMPGTLKLVVQTPSVRMDDTLLAMGGMSRATLEAMDRMHFRATRPFDITYGFYEEVRQNSAFQSYPIPMLILHGEEDTYIRMPDIQQFRRINERAKLVILPGIGHRFLEEGAWDMVLDLTRDWFEFEQVLLTDWS